MLFRSDAKTVLLTRGCILKAREDWVLLENNLPALEKIWNDKIGQRKPFETDFGIGTVTTPEV